MKPLPVDGPFDSAALSFVLHCLRGPEGNKTIAVRNIADVLSPEGVLFGGTVLGLHSNHTKPARAFLRAANKQGGFDNVDDTAEGVCRILEMSFSAVDVDVVRFSGPLRRGQATVPLLDAASMDSTLLGITGELCGLAGSDVEGVVAAMDTHAHTLVQGDGAVGVLRIHAEPNLPHASARQLGEGATKQ
jgi:hypothetical protein